VMYGLRRGGSAKDATKSNPRGSRRPAAIRWGQAIRDRHKDRAGKAFSRRAV
jgi:hypothetical protein